MRFPWQKPEPTTVSVTDITATVRAEMRGEWEQATRDAAQTARQETIAEVARALTPIAPAPSIPNANGVPVSHLGQMRPHGAYGFDRPITFSTPQPPTRKPLSLASTDTLRALADNYDILRACINQLKREVLSVPIEIVARDPKDMRRTTKKRLAEARALFEDDGAVGGFGEPRRHFESKLLEDVCVIGAGAIFHERARGGFVRQSVAIDAATIRPYVDGYGWAPASGDEGDDHVYEQWVYGMQVARFSRDDLTYDGIYPASYTPYFKSPVEYLLDAVDTALRSNMWNKGWLTDGNSPDDAFAMPETWTPEMVKSYAEFWDSLSTGTPNGRHKTRFLPGGSQRVGARSRKDQDFAGLDLWLVRRTCAILGVQPASIGFVGEQYKVSQENSMGQTTAFGTGVLLEWRKDKYDNLLKKHGYGEFECRNVTHREDSAEMRAKTNETLIRSGQRTPNECRKEDGRDSLPGADVLLIAKTLVPLIGTEGDTPPPNTDRKTPVPEDDSDPTETEN